MLPPSASHGLAIEVIDAQVRRLKTYAVPAQPGAVNLIERATDLVARAGDNVVEAALAAPSAGGMGFNGNLLSELRSVSRAAAAAAAYERDPAQLTQLLAGPDAMAHAVATRALRLGHDDALAGALAPLGKRVLRVLPLEDLADWGDLRIDACAALLAGLGVRHPLVFRAMARQGRVAELERAAHDAKALAPNDGNGGRGSSYLGMAWAFASALEALASVGQARAALALADAAPDDDDRAVLYPRIACAAARAGDLDTAATLDAACRAQGVPQAQMVWTHAWVAYHAAGKDPRRVRPRVEQMSALAIELCKAGEARRAKDALLRVVGATMRGLFEQATHVTVSALCDAWAFDDARELSRACFTDAQTVSPLAYIAHRAAWAGHPALACDIAKEQPDLDRVLGLLLGDPPATPGGDGPHERFAGFYAAIATLERQLGRSAAVVPGTPMFPTAPFRYLVRPAERS
jgi:hypothetical protein